MSTALDTDDFCFDYIFIKFANLASPAIIPWIEVADGKYIPEESTEDQIVILTKKKPGAEDVVALDSAEATTTKSHLKKEALISYLESKLRDPKDQAVVDYGQVEDIRIQPAGQGMSKSVYQFMQKYTPN